MIALQHLVVLTMLAVSVIGRPRHDFTNFSSLPVANKPLRRVIGEVHPQKAEENSLGGLVKPILVPSIQPKAPGVSEADIPGAEKVEASEVLTAAPDTELMLLTGTTIEAVEDLTHSVKPILALEKIDNGSTDIVSEASSMTIEPVVEVTENDATTVAAPKTAQTTDATAAADETSGFGEETTTIKFTADVSETPANESAVIDKTFPAETATFKASSAVPSNYDATQTVTGAINEATEVAKETNEATTHETSIETLIFNVTEDADLNVVKTTSKTTEDTIDRAEIIASKTTFEPTTVDVIVGRTEVTSPETSEAATISKTTVFDETKEIPGTESATVTPLAEITSGETYKTTITVEDDVSTLATEGAPATIEIVEFSTNKKTVDEETNPTSATDETSVSEAVKTTESPKEAAFTAKEVTIETVKIVTEASVMEAVSETTAVPIAEDDGTTVVTEGLTDVAVEIKAEPLAAINPAKTIEASTSFNDNVTKTVAASFDEDSTTPVVEATTEAATVTMTEVASVEPTSTAVEVSEVLETTTNTFITAEITETAGEDAMTAAPTSNATADAIEFKTTAAFEFKAETTEDSATEEVTPVEALSTSSNEETTQIADKEAVETTVANEIAAIENVSVVVTEATKTDAATEAAAVKTKAINETATAVIIAKATETATPVDETTTEAIAEPEATLPEAQIIKAAPVATDTFLAKPTNASTAALSEVVEITEAVTVDSTEASPVGFEVTDVQPAVSETPNTKVSLTLGNIEPSGYSGNEAPTAEDSVSTHVISASEAIGYNGIDANATVNKKHVAIASQRDSAIQNDEREVLPLKQVEMSTRRSWRPFTINCETETDDLGKFLCSEWARGGLCGSHRATMFLFCRRTCLCVGPPDGNEKEDDDFFNEKQRRRRASIDYTDEVVSAFRQSHPH